ncbi:MAG: nicotinate-nicotinamide nucleotide adenylyltransferase [Desulfovibrionaceae bacterium]|nr:nicotinate-nicotinamide nucleotide adenylyltransferase [Desulfovibrionaceae bacterium]
MLTGISSLALLGGSFNPPHFGHLRLALEMFEALRPDRLDFVPCAVPPHKEAPSLLPFDWRCAMLEDSLAALPLPWRFGVNRLEADLPGPSFTCATLRACRGAYSGARLYFILSAEDLAGLDSWKDWRDLPDLAILAVASRNGEEEEQVFRALSRLWPDCSPGRPRTGGGLSFTLFANREVCYIPVTRLDVNSSLIRALWLSGREIDFLAPAPVRDFLAQRAGEVRRYWA